MATRKKSVPVVEYVEPEVELTIHEKLNADHYKSKLEYPDRKDPEYKEKKKAYQEDDFRLYELFREDALTFVGLKDHPKAIKAFGLAWREGHSAGYSEVLCHLQDYAELLLED